MDNKELYISLLQLQRSALIDTQTVMQVMIDKGICEMSDIVETRSNIENNSEDVKRINDQLLELGVTVSNTPVPEGMMSRAELKDKLDELVEMLQKIG